MEHLLVKTILIKDVIELVSEKYKISLDESRDRVYLSGVVESIEDDETGLYGESALYIFSIYEKKIMDYNLNNVDRG